MFDSFLFIQQLFTECLLWIRLHSRSWHSERSIQGSPGPQNCPDTKADGQANKVAPRAKGVLFKLQETSKGHLPPD